MPNHTQLQIEPFIDTPGGFYIILRPIHFATSRCFRLDPVLVPMRALSRSRLEIVEISK